jgi:hypothetical protein
MNPLTFQSYPMDQLDALPAGPATDWLWHGYLARGNLTLLTSLWKAGKTTLLAGMLQHLDDGTPFLGRDCMPARSLIVSEESRQHWIERLRTMPIGSHVRLMARPFRGRPSPAEWEELIDYAGSLRQSDGLDLLVVDPLASFLPGRSDSDAGTLLTMLQPLQRLASTGLAVLLLHHPRKKPSDEGSSARGSGALLGFVDIILELHRFGRLQSDGCRRKLIGLSRHEETPTRVYYQWEPASGKFAKLDDPHGKQFRDNWSQLKAILSKRKQQASTHQELLMDWPPDHDKPAACVLYEWLSRATDEKLVRRSGSGRKTDPYRFRLPNQDDKYYDRGELPPLRDLVG